MDLAQVAPLLRELWRRWITIVRRVDPLIWFESVLMSTNDPSQLTKVVLRLTVGWCDHCWYILRKRIEGPTWHGHHRCARVHRHKAIVLLAIRSTEAKGLAIHFDVI